MHNNGRVPSNINYTQGGLGRVAEIFKGSWWKIITYIRYWLMNSSTGLQPPFKLLICNLITMSWKWIKVIEMSNKQLNNDHILITWITLWIELGLPPKPTNVQTNIRIIPRTIFCIKWCNKTPTYSCDKAYHNQLPTPQRHWCLDRCWDLGLT